MMIIRQENLSNIAFQSFRLTKILNKIVLKDVYINQTFQMMKTQNNLKRNKQIKRHQMLMISGEPEIKLYAQSPKTELQQEHIGKQIKMMKKQNIKLKAYLQYEIKGSTQTKQALLISQQENYNFRLQIQNLHRQIRLLTGKFTGTQTQKQDNHQIVLQSQQAPTLKSTQSQQSQSTKQQLQRFRNLNQKYEQHISILQGVKRDYLRTCIQAKEQVYRLKFQNQQLKSQIKQLKIVLGEGQNQSQNSNQNLQERNPDKIKFFQYKQTQLFKSKVHEISNCLPLASNQQLFLFRPDTTEQLVSMLQRILQFCKDIQQWQKQKVHAIQRQRSNLLKIISTVLLKHPTTKLTIAQQISQIEQLQYLSNSLIKEPKNIFQSPKSGFDQNTLQNKINSNQDSV